LPCATGNPGSLTTADFNNNPELEVVNLERNNIYNISFSENHKLKSLNIANNHINALDLTNNTKLINLMV